MPTTTRFKKKEKKWSCALVICCLLLLRRSESQAAQATNHSHHSNVIQQRISSSESPLQQNDIVFPDLINDNDNNVKGGPQQEQYQRKNKQRPRRRTKEQQRHHKSQRRRRRRRRGTAKRRRRRPKRRRLPLATAKEEKEREEEEDSTTISTTTEDHRMFYNIVNLIEDGFDSSNWNGNNGGRVGGGTTTNNNGRQQQQLSSSCVCPVGTTVQDTTTTTNGIPGSNSGVARAREQQQQQGGRTSSFAVVTTNLEETTTNIFSVGRTRQGRRRQTRNSRRQSKRKRTRRKLMVQQGSDNMMGSSRSVGRGRGRVGRQQMRGRAAAAAGSSHYYYYGSNHRGNDGRGRGQSSQTSQQQQQQQQQQSSQQHKQREKQRIQTAFDQIFTSSGQQQQQETAPSLSSSSSCRCVPVTTTTTSTTATVNPPEGSSAVTSVQAAAATIAIQLSDVAPGIIVQSSDGQSQPANIPGITDLGGGRARITIENQDYELEDAIIIQDASSGLVTISAGKVNIPSGGSQNLQLVNAFAQILPIGGNQFRFAKSRRRRQRKRRRRHLQQTGNTGFVFETLSPNNPTLEPLGDLSVSDLVGQFFGQSGYVSFDMLPADIQGYIRTSGDEASSSTPQFFYFSYSLGNLAAGVVGSSLFQFLTKDAPSIYSVLSTSQGILLFQAQNIGFPITIPTTPPAGLKVTVNNAVVGFSYQSGSLQLKRPDTIGNQYGILQEAITGSILLAGSIGISVTALDSSLTAAAGIDALNLGLRFTYTGGVIMDWDIEQMANNPNGLNGLLDFDLFTKFAITGSLSVKLKVGIDDESEGIDQESLSVLSTVASYIPSFECSFASATVQYLRDDSRYFKRALAIATGVSTKDCKMEPISSLLNLFGDTGAEAVVYAHLLEQSAQGSNNPELLIYGEGSTVLFGFNIASLTFQVQFNSITNMKITITGTLDLRIFAFSFSGTIEAGEQGVMLTTSQMVDLEDPFGIFMATLDAAFTVSWDVDSSTFSIMAYGEFCFRSASLGRRRQLDEQHRRRHLIFGSIGKFIQDAIDTVTDTVSDVTMTVTDAADAALDAITDTVEATSNTLAVVSTNVVMRVQDLGEVVFDFAADVINGITQLINFCVVASVQLKFVNGIPCLCIMTTLLGELCFGIPFL